MTDAKTKPFFMIIFIYLKEVYIMKEVFMIQVVDVNVDAAYDVHVTANVLPEAYTDYKEANKALSEALKEHNDASLIWVDLEDEDAPHAYGEPVEADYVE